MPLNLENLTAREAEALAYAEGYTGTARLFARIDELQRALGQAVAALDAIGYTKGTKAPGAAREALTLIQGITKAEGIPK
jgi:hypothetical protein